MSVSHTHTAFMSPAEEVGPGSIIETLVEAGRTQNAEAKMLTLDDVSFRLSWLLDTNHINFRKQTHHKDE